MKKWVKRILIVVVLLVVGTAAVLFTLRHLSQRRPDWYPAAADPAALAAAARSVEDKFSRIGTWAGETSAQERTQATGREPVPTDPATAPSKSSTISLTETELNAFFAKYDKQMRWGERYAEYVTDPVVVIEDNRLILAGTVKQMNTLVSVHFEPKLDEKGQIRMDVARVMGGSLPLPQAFWAGYRDRLVGALDRRADQDRRNVRIEPDGSANAAAVATAMNELLLRSLNSQPAEPVLFLPQGNDGGAKALTVKVTALTVKDETLSLTVQPLTATERTDLLDRLRNPKPPGDPAGTPVARAAGQGPAPADVTK